MQLLALHILYSKWLHMSILRITITENEYFKYSFTKSLKRLGQYNSQVILSSIFCFYPSSHICTTEEGDRVNV